MFESKTLCCDVLHLFHKLKCLEIRIFPTISLVSLYFVKMPMVTEKRYEKMWKLYLAATHYRCRPVNQLKQVQWWNLNFKSTFPSIVYWTDVTRPQCLQWCRTFDPITCRLSGVLHFPQIFLAAFSIILTSCENHYWIKPYSAFFGPIFTDTTNLHIVAVRF